VRKIFLVTYCNNDDITFLKTLLQQGDIIAGIDQGTDLLLQNGITPTYCLGDFDSTLTDIAGLGLPPQNIIRLKVQKEDSDLEYALQYFANTEAEIVVINNLQGRLDHILSVLNLLEAHPSVCIRSAKQDVYFVSNSFKASLPVGTTLSLLPQTETVEGITTVGLFYKLQGETLYKKKNRGLSNISVDKNIEINFLDGQLLVVINRLEG